MTGLLASFFHPLYDFLFISFEAVLAIFCSVLACPCFIALFPLMSCCRFILFLSFFCLSFYITFRFACHFFLTCDFSSSFSLPARPISFLTGLIRSISLSRAGSQTPAPLNICPLFYRQKAKSQAFFKKLIWPSYNHCSLNVHKTFF